MRKTIILMLALLMICTIFGFAAPAKGALNVYFSDILYLGMHV